MLLLSCVRKPTTLRMALWGFPEHFDVLRSGNMFTSIIVDNIYETLTAPNFFNQPQKVLIDHYYFVSDTVIVVQLANGIRFSDGSPLTPEDIIESAQRYHSYLPNKSTFHFTKIVPIASNIIHFYLDSENCKSFNMDHFSNMPIYKGEYIQVFDEELLGELPLGTGPYFLYCATDTSAVLKKNHFYRDYTKMRKSPDIIEYYYEPDIQKQYQMLINNEVDFILDMDFLDYSNAITNPNIKIYSRLSDNFAYLALDSMSPYRQDINLRTNPLQDKRVRKAIAHSINMEHYINEQLLGQAIALTMPAPVQVSGYPTYLPYYAYDIKLAKSLLEEAGVGSGFKMNLFATNGGYSTRMAELVQESLADINIEVDITYFDGIDLHYELPHRPPSSYIARYSLPHPANTRLEQIIRSHLNYTPTYRGSLNYHKLYNPRIDALLDSLLVESEDIEANERGRMHSRLIEAVYEEVMLVPLFQPFLFHALRKDIVWNTKKNHMPLGKEFEMR